MKGPLGFRNDLLHLCLNEPKILESTTNQREQQNYAISFNSLTHLNTDTVIEFK